MAFYVRKKWMIETISKNNKKLWKEEVTFNGYVKVEDAKIYIIPKKPPILVGAAISPETAEWIEVG